MYSEDETLLIHLPRRHVPQSLFDHFSGTSRLIKSLVIVQENPCSFDPSTYPSSFVTIPETLANLTDLESISISAYVRTLPECLCTLPNLHLLDLNGCYDSLSISSEVLAMPNLKIKIGDLIVPASEVIVIEVPNSGVPNDIFAALSDLNNGKISHIIIHQNQGPYGTDAPFTIPDDIYRTEGIRSVWIAGNVTQIPKWIFKQKHLNCLRLSGRFDNIPEALGEMQELNYLNLSNCHYLKSLPSSLGKLSKLTSVNLSGCYNLVSIPESIGNLSQLNSLNLTKCCRLASLPPSVGHLPDLKVLQFSDCSSLQTVPMGILRS